MLISKAFKRHARYILRTEEKYGSKLSNAQKKNQVLDFQTCFKLLIPPCPLLGLSMLGVLSMTF